MRVLSIFEVVISEFTFALSNEIHSFPGDVHAIILTILEVDTYIICDLEVIYRCIDICLCNSLRFGINHFSI